jgi:N-acetylglucosaminyl-diphospho-decaprenol L-rhamnosyltransferase
VDLSIIIVNWKSAEYTRVCLSLLYRHIKGITFEVVVVDNASDDDCERILRAEFPRALFIPARKNLGFARANNLGFQHSKGEILLFLNPDTEVHDDSIVRMFHELCNDDAAGAAGARLLNSDGSLQTSCVQSFPTIANQLLDFDVLRRAFPTWRLWGSQALYATGQPASVDAISGACFMVKRTVFERVGLFSDTYFMYSDDLDLSYKVRRAGYKTVYLGDCTIVHHGGKSSEKQNDNFSDLWQRESLAQFFRSTRGGAYATAFRAGMALMSILRMGAIICVLPFGQIGIRGKQPALILAKWSKILRWAIGMEIWARPDKKTVNT